MKGPRSRHKFSIVRVWECAHCKKRVLTSGQTVNRACYCMGSEQTAWMRVIDESSSESPRNKWRIV